MSQSDMSQSDSVVVCVKFSKGRFGKSWKKGEALPAERAGEFYKEATRGRSASHHLQVKAALALLYDVLGATNPFAECAVPKFAPEKIELRYHTASQLGQLLRELREDRRSYFGHLTYHLATALFFTGCRFSRVGATHHRPARP
jgi:hypothetical protein